VKKGGKGEKNIPAISASEKKTKTKTKTKQEARTEKHPWQKYSSFSATL